MSSRERFPVLSTKLPAPVRLAAAAPTWVLCALAAVGATSVAVVAGAEQHPTDVASAETAVAPPVPVAPVADRPTTPVTEQRSAALSRSSARVSSRTAARTRKKHRLQREEKQRQQRQQRRRHRSHAPRASNDAAQTVSSALDSTFNVPGQCLAWSREQAGIPSRYSDAATAWEHATGRHAADRNPPRGAAVYWTGGSRGYGHVAISLGNGRVRSSDAAGYGEVGTIRINKLSSE